MKKMGFVFYLSFLFHCKVSVFIETTVSLVWVVLRCGVNGNYSDPPAEGAIVQHNGAFRKSMRQMKPTHCVDCIWNPLW